MSKQKRVNWEHEDYLLNDWLKRKLQDLTFYADKKW